MTKPLAEVMAIVNRTPDSFYDKGATFASEKALLRIDDAVAAGATIIDIGGVKAGPGDEVTVAEETERVVPLIAAARSHMERLVPEAFVNKVRNLPEGETRTVAEMSAAEKDAISHRARAAAALRPLLARAVAG